MSNLPYFKIAGEQDGKPVEIEWMDGRFTHDPGLHASDLALSRVPIRFTPTGPTITAEAETPYLAMMTAASTFDTPVFEVLVDPDNVLADLTAAIYVPADAIP